MRMISITGTRLQTLRKDLNKGRKVILTRETGNQLIITRQIDRETGDEYFRSYIFNITTKTQSMPLTHLSFEKLEKGLEGLGFRKYEAIK